MADVIVTRAMARAVVATTKANEAADHWLELLAQREVLKAADIGKDADTYQMALSAQTQLENGRQALNLAVRHMVASGMCDPKDVAELRAEHVAMEARAAELRAELEAVPKPASEVTEEP